MKNRSLQEYLELEFPFEVCQVDEDDGVGFYYFAFHPDFGKTACSAVGDSEKEAIEELNLMRKDVIYHYYETGRTIPEPSKKQNIE